MPVIKEWKCKTCGFFESDKPICIHCGTTDIARVFLTPPGFKSDKTKFTDENLDSLALQFGRTNFSNNQSTAHTPDLKDTWKPLPTKKNSDGKQEINLAGELARVVGGGVSVPKEAPILRQTVPTILPGQYEPIVHPEDRKVASP